MVALITSALVAVDVATIISCRDLIVYSLAKFRLVTKFLCRNIVFVLSQFGPCRDNFLLSPSVCVVTTLSCCDLTVLPFTEFCVATSFPCRDQAVLPFIGFCVAISFLLSAILIHGHNFPSCCDIMSSFLPSCKLRLQLLICLFSCRDMEIRLRQGSFFSQCHSCRDLKRMSRPFFLLILSQPHFLLTTVSHQFIFFFWSRPR